jgi:hypothetical protein
MPRCTASPKEPHWAELILPQVSYDNNAPTLTWHSLANPVLLSELAVLFWGLLLLTLQARTVALCSMLSRDH